MMITQWTRKAMKATPLFSKIMSGFALASLVISCSAKESDIAALIGAGTPVPAPTAVNVVNNGSGSSLSIVGGNSQTVVVNSQASQPLTVIAKDASGTPVSNSAVTFGVSGPGSVSSTTVQTDSNGLASVNFTALSTSGVSTVTANSAQGSVSFTLTIASYTNYALGLYSGNGQSGAVGATLSGSNALKVTVLDGNGVLAQNVPVYFTVIGGNGTLGGASSYLATSDANGIAQTPFTLGTASGVNTIKATISGAPSITTSFTETGTVAPTATIDPNNSSIVLSQSTATANGSTLVTVTVQARDAYNNLIPNAAQTVNVTFTAGLGGAWQTSSTFTYTGTGTYTNIFQVGSTQGIEVFTATVSGVTLANTTNLTVNGGSTLASGGATLVVVSGDGQTTAINTLANSSLIVLARDSLGKAISGQAITFTVSGPGTVSSNSQNTNGSGQASVNFTATGSAGTATVTATSPQGTVTFTITVVALTSYQITIVSGNNQSAVIGSTLSATPLKVQVTDGGGAAAPNISVAFAIQTGAGNIGGQSSTAVNTDSNGYASINNFTLGTTGGTNTVKAAIAGAPSLFTTFTETGTVPSASAVDTTQSTITLSQTSSQANGTNLVTVTVYVRDQYGNLIPNAGQTVSVAVTAGLGAWQTSSTFAYVTTGTYQNSYQVGTTSGNATFTAHVNGSTLANTQTLTLNTGNTTAAGGAHLSIVSGNTQTVIYSQAAPAPLKVLAVDSLGIPINGSVITYTITSGTGNFSGASSTTATTGSDGTAQVTFTGGAVAGSTTVTASSLQGNVSFSLTIQNLNGYTISIVNSSTTNNQSGYLNAALANNLKVQVLDSGGAPVTGLTVQFQCQSANCGSFSNGNNSITATSDGTGYASVPYTLGTAAGVYTIRALLPPQNTIYTDFTAIASVNPSATPSLSLTTVVLSSASVVSNGTQSITVSVTLTDQYGNTIPSCTPTVTVAPSPSNLGSWAGGSFTCSGSSGIYSRIYSVGTSAGTITFTGSIGASALTSNAPVLTAAASNVPNGATTIISALNTSLVANGIANTTVSVTLEDQFGSQIAQAGHTVVLAISSGSGTLGSVAYNSVTGTYQATYTSPIAIGTGSAVISVSSVDGSTTPNGTTLTNANATISLVAGPISTTISTFTVPSHVVTAINTAQTLTVQLYDANSNPITTGATVAISRSPSGGVNTTGTADSISSVTNVGGGKYTFTLTSPSSYTNCTVAAPCVDTLLATATIGGTVYNLGAATGVNYAAFASASPAAAQSTFVLNKTSGIAGTGSDQIIATVTLKNSSSQAFTVGGFSSLLTATTAFGSVGITVVDNNNGTYTITVPSPATSASGNLNILYNGTNIASSPTSITFVGSMSLVLSTITMTTTTFNGPNSATITLTPKDSNGFQLPYGVASNPAATAIQFTQNGTLTGGNSTFGTVTMVNSGGYVTYTQVITRAATPVIGNETATISAQYYNGSAWVNFSANQTLTITPPNLAGVTINCANVSSYNGQNLYVNGGTLTINSWVNGSTPTSGCGVASGAPFTFASLTVANTGIVTHTAGTSSNVYGIDIILTGNLTVVSGGQINVASMGYAAGYTMNNIAVSGTSYGSYGGAGAGNSWGPCTGCVYGNSQDPNYPGQGSSGGYSTAPGGGIVRIIANSMTIDGTINANGGNGSAGGSIKLTATGNSTGACSGTCSGTITTPAGSGLIESNGGGTGGNAIGAGGRIAIYGDSSQFPIGNIYAMGAGGNENNTPYNGTLYLTNGPSGTLPQVLNFDSSTTTTNSYWGNTSGTKPNLTLFSGGAYGIAGAVTLGNLIFNGNASLTFLSAVSSLNVTNLTMTAASTITHSALTPANFIGSSAPYGPSVNITATGTITIPSTASIEVASKGYPGGTTYLTQNNCGVGNGFVCQLTPLAGQNKASGGCHYTQGGNLNLVSGQSATWGVINGPDYTYGGSGSGAIGSGYAGGSGGGIIQITAGTLSNNGTIDASGGNSSSSNGNYQTGGGAGGSININATTLTGTGAITATGGYGTPGGTSSQFPGGAGGLIYINATTNSSSITTSVVGGIDNTYPGAAGVVSY